MIQNIKSNLIVINQKIDSHKANLSGNLGNIGLTISKTAPLQDYVAKVNEIGQELSEMNELLNTALNNTDPGGMGIPYNEGEVK